MTQDHPITPPDELLEHWRVVGNLGNWQNALTLAYRAGADQELEACCEWVEREIGHGRQWNAELRAARRPAPSLKEQALQLVEVFTTPSGRCGTKLTAEQCDTIRRALEQLDD
jgi:hypothetical protein